MVLSSSYDSSDDCSQATDDSVVALLSSKVQASVLLVLCASWVGMMLVFCVCGLTGGQLSPRLVVPETAALQDDGLVHGRKKILAACT
jgi:hypothetical protein